MNFLHMLLLLITACSAQLSPESQPLTVPARTVNATSSLGTCPSETKLAEAQEQLAEDISLTLVGLLRGFTQDNPASSCSAINPSNPSGYYWILPPAGPPAVRLYCDFNRQCGCDGSSTWTRVAFLNMTDPNQNCPQGWMEPTSPDVTVRSCTGIGLSSEFNVCNSSFFSTHQLSFSRVCGCIVGYQHAQPDAFNSNSNSEINTAYLDGVSLTYGPAGSRQHIWSFVAAQGDGTTSLPDTVICSCSHTRSWPYSTQFIGNDYFCDSGNHRNVVNNRNAEFFAEDPLWDGAGCSRLSSCCQFNTPPWFCKTLPNTVTDDLEVRICHLGGGLEDTPIHATCTVL